MWAEFEAVTPAILGGLVSAISRAMKDVASVTGDFPRMADFAKWSIAAAPALGFSGEDFIKAYATNRNKSVLHALDESPIYLPLHRLLEDGDFRGTTKELLYSLVYRTGNMTVREGGLPPNARALSSALERLIPNLRADGVTVRHLGRDPVKRVRILEISKERTPKEIAAKQRTEEQINDAIASKSCQRFLKDVLRDGPLKTERRSTNGRTSNADAER